MVIWKALNIICKKSELVILIKTQLIAIVLGQFRVWQCYRECMSFNTYMEFEFQKE